MTTTALLHQQITRLQAALAYYTTATYVSDWGNQELADDGELARRVLADTTTDNESPLGAATCMVLVALTVAQDAAQQRDAAWHASTEAQYADSPDADALFTAYLDSARHAEAAAAEVDQARARVASLLANTPPLGIKNGVPA